MTKQFLKAGQISLVNGGYVVTTDGEKPVSNKAFIQAQTRAEYVCTFAQLAKGKDFKGKRPDSLTDLENEVRANLATKKKLFVSKPEVVEQSLTAQLKEEALSFINFQENSSKADSINAFLQEFTVLAEFDEFGLFFEEDIVKLNKLYTIEEVVEAVTSVIDLLK